MRWTDEAETAIRKVPFFVRKRVRKTIESQVMEQGRSRVTVDDINRAKQAYLSSMASKVKGYQCDACFGASGCPNRIGTSDRLMETLEAELEKAGLLEFLKASVTGELKFHHEFRLTLADCPNACSQPQIKDMGIISASVPGLSGAECTGCGECVAACRDDAVTLDAGGGPPVIDADRCQKCGQCITVCPTGCITQVQRGYRIQLGGRLGRHPRLAMELDGIYTEEEVVKILRKALDFYKTHSTGGKRFSQILTAEDLHDFAGM